MLLKDISEIHFNQFNPRLFFFIIRHRFPGCL